jgi:hypothetical protein
MFRGEKLPREMCLFVSDIRAMTEGFDYIRPTEAVVFYNQGVDIYMDSDDCYWRFVGLSSEDECDEDPANVCQECEVILTPENNGTTSDRHIECIACRQYRKNAHHFD